MGNTYNIRQQLKENGAFWMPDRKGWKFNKKADGPVKSYKDIESLIHQLTTDEVLIRKIGDPPINLSSTTSSSKSPKQIELVDSTLPKSSSSSKSRSRK